MKDEMRIVIWAIIFLMTLPLQAAETTVPPGLAGKILTILSKNKTVEVIKNGSGLTFRIDAFERTYDTHEPKYNGRFLSKSTMWLPRNSGIIVELAGPIDRDKHNEASSFFRPDPPHFISYTTIYREDLNQLFCISWVVGVDFSQETLKELRLLENSSKKSETAK